MIIGLDASRANKKEKTGTEWYSYYLIQEMKKISDQNDQFILYSKEALSGGLENLPSNFKSKVLKWPPKFLWTQIRLSWEMLWHRPDLLFITAHTIPLFHPKNTICTLHDVGFERLPDLYSKEQIGYQPSLWKKLVKLMVKIFTLGKYGNTELDYHRFSARFALKHAKKVITVSQFSRQEITDIFAANPEKIIVIYHGYDQKKYRAHLEQTKIDNILKKYQIDKPFFLSIGRLEEKKNTAGLIEAFGLFKNWKNEKINYQLVLVGSPGYNFQKVKDKIEKYHLKDSVIMPGWMPEDEIPYLMGAAEIFIFPSFYEGFGVPLLEAMACGTPIITSNLSSLPEVADWAALLINPYNPTEIASAMIKLTKDKDLRNELVKKGWQRIKNFSWSICARKTLEVLKKN